MRALILILTLAASPALAASYAIVDAAGTVENVVVADAPYPVPPPQCAAAPCQMVPVASLTTQQAAQLLPPAPSPQAPSVLQIVSTGTPALDGSYAIDAAAQQTMAAIAAGIAAANRVPGGGASFNYADASGTPHAFTGAQFIAFASAIEDAVYALSQGQVPAQPVTIP